MNYCKCGKELSDNQTTYCSKKCSGKYRCISNHSEGKIKERTIYEIECQFCHKIVRVRAFKKNDKYCSRKCGATAANIAKGKRSEETRLKISKSINSKNKEKGISRIDEIKICKECGKDFKYKNSRTIFCSNSCSIKNRWKDLEYKSKMIQHLDKLEKGWKSRKYQSYAEKFWENILIKNDINSFEIEKVFKHSDLGLSSRSCYRIDFYFEHLKLAVEIDGIQHRRHRDRVESDKTRDKILRKNGITTMRFPWYGLKGNNLNKTFEQVHILLNILSLKE